MSAIRCVGLGKRYRRDGVRALDGLDLVVPAGAVFGFLGPNGAGKTTTIRILTGLAAATTGEAWVAGERVRRGAADLARKIGCLDQDPRFYPWMTGRELLVLVARLAGFRGARARAHADELLGLAGLEKAAGRRIGGYSGGMLQRVGIAAAVAGHPEVLFLDEPCASLDPLGRRDVLEFIGRLRGRTTVFMSTHILSDVERVCDTVGIIRAGRMVTVDRTDVLERTHARKVLEVEMESADAAAALAERLTRRGLDPVRPEGARLRLISGDPGAARTAVIQELASSGLPLIRLDTRASSLEEVFVRLVGGAP